MHALSNTYKVVACWMRLLVHMNMRHRACPVRQAWRRLASHGWWHVLALDLQTQCEQPEKTQACMRPCSADSLPIMGKVHFFYVLFFAVCPSHCTYPTHAKRCMQVPGYSGAYLNFAHNCWCVRAPACAPGNCIAVRGNHLHVAHMGCCVGSLQLISALCTCPHRGILWAPASGKALAEV